LTNSHLFKVITLTGLALIAFAANSVLCRLALENEAIDAASFTVIRLLSGCLVLLIILSISPGTNRAIGQNETVSHSKGSWGASFMLFLYATTFSYAYISLGTATGALILFGSVQISGTRLHFTEWIGVVIAFTGFIYLILPGINTPSAAGFALMTAAGIGWGIYTLKGRGSENPLMDTAYNFLRTIPLVALLAIFSINNVTYSSEGIVLALLSGGVTSGIGYTIWYIALGGLSSTQAAVVQLSVPVIAALGGVIFVSEAITFRLTISAAVVLGGILIVVLGKYYFTQAKLSPKI
jgi:drug/metabolite transporter (DMT)-like permease